MAEWQPWTPTWPLACPICLDSFQDPVLLNCGHNFCQACITQLWEGLEENFSCPKCGKRFQERHVHPNPLLGKALERARQLGWGAEGSMCQKHKEMLKLYCREDQALICVVCDRSKEHRAHTVVPLEEAAQEYKVTASNTGHLEQSSGAGRGEASMDGREVGCPRLRIPTCPLSPCPPQSHTKAEKQRVVSTFQQLYRLLQEKERLLLKGLGNVAQGVTQLQQENISRGLLCWLWTGSDWHEGCYAVLGLALKGRGWLFCIYERKGGCDAVYGLALKGKGAVVLYVDLLRFSPALPEILTLDAASAHPGLVVSPDRHSVFFPASCILGSEGFSSGRHRWEVEVGGEDGWAVGVARESVRRRRGPMKLQPQHGVWAVELGRYQLLPLSLWSPKAAPSQRPHRIRVCLDYEGGRVSFYDAENLTPLFTFTASFTETLYPFFWLWAPGARITLCP
uniref:RING-type E3 ubiquitin transferase n=1 Tax=Chelydra serpentina TaxID=8475 RepID=A0A8C3XHU4_CHESE